MTPRKAALKGETERGGTRLLKRTDHLSGRNTNIVSGRQTIASRRLLKRTEIGVGDIQM